MSALADELRRAPRERLRDVAERGAAAVHAECVARAPVVTGRLRDSFAVTATIDSDTEGALHVAAEVYARYVGVFDKPIKVVISGGGGGGVSFEKKEKHAWKRKRKPHTWARAKQARKARRAKAAKRKRKAKLVAREAKQRAREAKQRARARQAKRARTAKRAPRRKA